MNWDRIEGNWKQFKGQAKRKWGELTDDDIDKLEGRRDELIGKIQERKGIARDRAEKEVNEFIKRRTRLYFDTWVLPALKEMVER